MGDFKFPVILKTSQGHRGEGVHKVENINKLKKLVKEITEGALKRAENNC